MGERRAQRQVQAGLTGLGKGPSLPKALPAAGYVVWDGGEISLHLGVRVPCTARCPNHVILILLILQMRLNPETSELKAS